MPHWASIWKIKVIELFSYSPDLNSIENAGKT